MKKRKRINHQKQNKVVSIDDTLFDLKKTFNNNDDNKYAQPTLIKKETKTKNQNKNYSDKKNNNYAQPNLIKKETKTKSKNKNYSDKKNNNYAQPTLIKKETKTKNQNKNYSDKKNNNNYAQPTLIKKETKTKPQNKNYTNKNNSTNSYECHEPVLKKKNVSLYSNEVNDKNKDENENNTTSYKKNHFKVKKIIILLLFILLVGIVIYLMYSYQVDRLEKEQKIKDEQLVSNIMSHFNEYVIVDKDAIIYSYDNDSDEYMEIGMIYQGVHLSLEEREITKNTKYFYIPYLDCYIEYKNVLPVEELQDKDNRYKNYIPFNKNVVTDNDFTLYSGDNKLYTFKKSMSFPIIINDYDNKYCIEFNNEMLYLLKDDVENIVDSENTKLKNTASISVLNYHFIYDSNKKCNQSICLSAKRFEEHLKYIKNQNIFTPTMNEFELYLDKKIQLPKSVLLTFDDGWLRQTAIRILDEYEINATYFLVTSWYLPIESKYVEYHSHTHNMHNQGDCPIGQGGGIQCLSEKKIQADLAKSRSILNNTTVFCYPFYEYNNYSISQLKKAGFTMAFIGGNRKAYPGVNKHKIPRYVIYNTTTVDNLKKII